MDQEQNQMQSAPQLCKNGCGFYGSQSFDGLCSKCHKDANKKDSPPSDSAADLSYVLQDTSALLHSAGKSTLSLLSAQKQESAAEVQIRDESVGGDIAATTDETATSSPSASPAEDAPSQQATPPSPAGAASDDDANTPKKKKNRCEVCRKKVGLTGFTCRCDGLFCSIHRYSDKHECDFDYRQLGQQEIRKNNPVVVGEKVNKI